VKQAASHASVSVALIYAWCRDGTLPHMRVGAWGKRGHIRIAVEDLDAVLAGFKVGKREPTPAPLPAPAPITAYRHVRLSKAPRG
jgi:hypothetical protein